MSLEKIQREVEKALKDSKRGDTVKLVVASKYFNVDQILKLYQLGLRDFAENRVDSALEKIEALPKDIYWHFIGHLQKNKVNKIIDKFELIQSIDSFNLAELISKRSLKKQRVLIQIKTSLEESKTGYLIQDFIDDYPKLKDLENIEICGLMTIAPKSDDLKIAAAAFKKLNLLRRDLKQNNWELSMGMSLDYTVAIDQGATMVRIGKALIT